MRQSMRLCLILPAFASAGAGCSRQVFSPPARAIALETARTQRPGQASVQGSYARGGVIPFGPDIAVAELKLSHGVTDDVELDFDGGYLRVTDETDVETAPDLYSGRIGVKYNPGDSFAAITGGAGGGYSFAGGGFVAADAGLIVAYENCHVVPYASTSAFLSVPLRPRAIVVGRDENQMDIVDTPETTIGASLGSGLRVVLEPGLCHDRRPTGNLTLGVSGTRLSDQHDSDDYFIASLGIEIPL